MTIPVKCSSCNSRLKAPDEAVGRKLKCPKCGTPIAVVARDEGLASSSCAVPSAAASPASEPEPDTDPFHFQADVSQEEESSAKPVVRPSKGAEATSRIPILVTVAIVVVLSVAVTLAGVAFFGKGTSGGSGGPQLGSGNRLTKENFLKITIGMPREDVELILGRPTKQDFSSMPYVSLAEPGYVTSYWEWTEGTKRIYVECSTQNNNGVMRVVRKQQSGLE